MLIWLLVPVVTVLRGFAKPMFVAAVGVAVVIEAIGAFYYTGVTDTVFAERGPMKMEAAWDWRNAPFIAPLRHDPAPADLLIATRGSFDAVQLNGRTTSVVTAGQQVSLAGWALAEHATPYQVEVVVGGERTVDTVNFLTVRRARDAARREFRRVAPFRFLRGSRTWRLRAGAYVWAVDGGDRHFLLSARLTGARHRR